MKIDRVYSLVDSVVVNGTEWPHVTTPFYSDPSGIPIIVGDDFTDHARRTEKTRCEEFAKQHRQMDVSLTMLLWQTIDTEAMDKDSMIQLLRRKVNTAWEFMQAIR